ncbi:uncharacterized protein LOC126745454 [Anthonomus grandis grandis]|uniref:uncharacterized protein LOC126745454 n=1 Tax=Anthonomus grandis grandis TaxID=2921223 RepID=UPI002165F603|nr:uncharacterized protein LOC126745454 [Anthonomus grandis grandis]
MSTTRSAIECPIFDAPKDLVCSVLPTFSDVIKYFLWIRHNLEESQVNRNLLVSEASEVVAQKIEEIWKSASVPTVSHQRIVALIKEYQKKRKDLLKPYRQRKDVPSYKSKAEHFVKDSQRLFDVAVCKCVDFQNCSCSKPNKVPLNERPFLQDQRSDRKMMIGSVDFKAVRHQQKRENRSQKDNIAEKPKPSTSFDSSDILLLEGQPDFESEQGKYDNDEDSLSPELPLFSDNPSTSNSNRNTSSLCMLANTLDRYAVSDRAGAAIASAVLQDYGIISSEDSQNIIDRHKVRRARQKKRQELQKTSKIGLLRGLYFDGRKDKTLIFTDNRKRTVVKEHITLLQEPGSNYIGHLSPVSGLSILNSLTEFLDNSSISLDSLEAVGCDGTNINVGSKGGIISLLERNIKRPLQWFICQLHANELPLRHILQHLDGETTGPQAFRGPIGKLLNDCEKLPSVEFSIIACELPDIDTNLELSTDQKYLYEICLAIKNGYCSESLLKRDPGRLVHSRWLITANRLLRLYVSTANPTQNLIILVTFIIKSVWPYVVFY